MYSLQHTGQPCKTHKLTVHATSTLAKMKYVVVTGGVVSGLGKGISISSIGVLLKSCGLRVTAIKVNYASISVVLYACGLRVTAIEVETPPVL